MSMIKEAESSAKLKAFDSAPYSCIENTKKIFSVIALRIRAPTSNYKTHFVYVILL